MPKRICPTALLILASLVMKAQVCSTTSGQTPSSAILICSNDAVTQHTVPICGGANIPACNDPFTYQDKNPFWYKVSCYVSGSLGFIITPDNLNDNYDWQLFDVSNRNPVDVFTDPALFVACNWSADPGETGASADGATLTVCYGPFPLFSSMPDIIAGHEYLILVSNREGTSTGFSLVIAGGTASITDPQMPAVASARQSCDGTKVIVKMNRGMKCGSLAPDGSDFIISGGYIVTGATSTGCGFAPTTDSVVLSLNAPLPNGNYTVTIQDGTDGNTLLDICNRMIPSGQQVGFTVAPLLPTPMDSITKPGCSPNKFRLYFSRPIRCNSIAGNGSEFVITGPQGVTISNISTSCNTNNPITSFIDLNLTSPVFTGGSYRVTLATGTDGNTIIDECGRETPAGSFLLFTVPGGVSADFTYSIKASCKENIISFLHDGNNGVTGWNWALDNVTASTQQNPVITLPASGNHTIRLIVTNGSCKDTATESIKLNNEIIAAFDGPKVLCPGDAVHFINNTKGTVDTWSWNFGDGNTSNQHSPPVFLYPENGRENIYTVSLVAFNTALNCSDTAILPVKVLANCMILVPSAFSPNGDGKNDYFYPLNALKADNLDFRVYNRYGQSVFVTKDWTKKWDGRVNGMMQQTGVFAWMLSYTHHDTGEKIFMRGTVLLIR
jgi:gliding motility-associated-like protein